MSDDKKQTTKTDEIIGMALREIRQKNKMSQEELGNKVGVRYQQIQKYENAENRISSSRLKEFADIFGVTPNYFFGFKDNEIFTGKNEEFMMLFRSWHELPTDNLQNIVSEFVVSLNQEVNNIEKM